MNRAITDPVVAADIAAELAALRARVDALTEQVNTLKAASADAATDEEVVQL